MILLKYFEVCTKTHFVSLLFLNKRNITTSLLMDSKAIVPRGKLPPDNWPPDNCPPYNCPRGKLPPEKLLSDNYPRGKLLPGNLTPRHKIFSKNNCPHSSNSLKEYYE